MSNWVTFTAKQPEQIEFELRTTFNLHDWRKVRDALNKGKEGYWGPARFLIDAIDSVIKQAGRVYDPEKPEGA